MSAHFSAVYGKTPPVENLGSLASLLGCRCRTSFRRRFFLVHRLLLFRLLLSHCWLYGEIKTPAYLPVSRGWKNPISILYLLTPSLSKLPSGRCPMVAVDSPRLNTQPWLYRL